jgi:pilus assembly protein FimV
VRKFKLKKWVAAGLLASMPYAGLVDAAGLGRLNVLSQLGQPFLAEIDLVNVSREELATLKANLAPPSAYQASNLAFNPALNALRLSIEKRPNGQAFIRASSFRPVAEPFLDLVVELTWQGGKVVREYSALLDPPGIETPAPAVSAPVAEAPAPKPPVAEAPAAAAPAQTAPVPVAPAPVAKPAAEPGLEAKTTPRPLAPRSSAGQYTVKSGDTLSGIAGANKPEGVSLEQMLIGLFRANPDAFTNNNINNLSAGKILTIPEREQLAAITQGDAAQEVRVHATNWYAYRAKVADAAPAAAEATPSAKGKITARVEDKAAPAAPKDVVVLSKGDAGKGGKGEDRVRALQEDLAARDKALTESRERIAMLEKALQDAKKLAEVKSATLAPAKGAEKGADKGADKGAKAEPKMEAKAEPKAEPKADAKALAKAEPPKVEPPKVEPPKIEPPKVEPPKPDAKADAPAPKKAAPPPPAPEPDLLDTVIDNIVPIGGGAAALLAGGVGFWALRRRKRNTEDDDEPAAPVVRAEPFRGKADADVPMEQQAAHPAVSNVSDVVDPIDEAQVYIDHGRDAQAEEILKEAMARDPSRQDIPLKLLEVYAARGDKDAFNALAQSFHQQTGGVGDNWSRAAAMGYAVDPGNPLYPSTGEGVVDLTGGASDTAGGGLDFELGGAQADTAADSLGTTTDILLDQDVPTAGDEGDLNRTMVLTRDAPQTAAEPEAPALPDFNIELPPASAPAAEPAGNMLDFNIDVPAASEPATQKVEPAPESGSGGLDFKVDFGGLSLNLDDKPAVPAAAPAAAGGAHDAHWEDVQQKFDLARAYQEMGDKEGAIEILREVEQEGDAGQKAEAQQMLASLK